MKGRLSWSIFWTLIVVFFMLIVNMLTLAFRGSSGLWFFGIVGSVFFLLGGALIFLTVKEKVGGVAKKFLILTGASAVGLPVFAVLHNVVSGLLDTEEPVFFVLATIVCPLGFLVGAVGSIVIAIKNKRAGNSS